MGGGMLHLCGVVADVDNGVKFFRCMFNLNLLRNVRLSDKFVNVLLEVIVLLAQRALEAEKADLNRRVADAKMTGAEAARRRSELLTLMRWTRR
jgi:hypothetical protein